MSDEQLGVFRKCERCDTYRSVDDFVALSHICTPCMRGTSKYHLTGRTALARSIVITPQGRAAIREVQPAA